MRAEIKDCTLWYETRGAGKPLVLVHGFGSDHKSWDGLFEALSARRLVLRYDLRGFGASIDKGSARFSHAADLAALLGQLKIGPVDLIGVSMGGAVAANFALNYAAQVDRLVLISPTLVGWEWTPVWRAAWSQIVREARAGNLDAARDLWWRHPVFETIRANPKAGARHRAAIAAYSCSHWAHGDRQELVTTPDVERLHTLAAPTLLLTGEKDVEDFRIIAEIVMASASRATRIDYAGAGHLLHLEEPERFVKDVGAFLG